MPTFQFAAERGREPSHRPDRRDRPELLPPLRMNRHESRFNACTDRHADDGTRAWVEMGISLGCEVRAATQAQQEKG